MNKLPQRKNIRLKNYNYSQAGYYFITICTYNKQCIFGEIINGIMRLNKYGEIAKSNVEAISKHIKGIIIDNYVIMPNHVHMILIVLSNNVGTRYIVPGNNIGVRGIRTPCMASLQSRSKQIVPKAIQQFKASVTRATKMNCLWQERYYDHVIRNESAYLQIYNYIDTNPQKWEEDCYYVQ